MYKVAKFKKDQSNREIILGVTSCIDLNIKYDKVFDEEFVSFNTRQKAEHAADIINREYNHKEFIPILI